MRANSKGDRDAIMTRMPRQIGVAARRLAAQQGLTISDYVASLLAREAGLPFDPENPRGNEEELPLTG